MQTLSPQQVVGPVQVRPPHCANRTEQVLPYTGGLPYAGGLPYVGGLPYAAGLPYIGGGLPYAGACARQRPKAAAARVAYTMNVVKTTPDITAGFCPKGRKKDYSSERAIVEV